LDEMLWPDSAAFAFLARPNEVPGEHGLLVDVEDLYEPALAEGSLDISLCQVVLRQGSVKQEGLALAQGKVEDFLDKDGYTALEQPGVPAGVLGKFAAQLIRVNPKHRRVKVPEQ